LDSPYCVAILADIHSNFDALEAVLTDLAGQQYDLMVIAGDLVTNGPQPAEVLACVRDLRVSVIYGNMDVEVIQAAPSQSIGWWTQQQLTKGDLAYLKQLPLSYRVTPPGGKSPQDDLLVVHASPRSANDLLILEPHPLGTTFTTVTPEEEAAAMLGGEQANLIVYGHIHYFSSGTVREQRVMSIGSVGFPFDGNPQASYALAKWDEKKWSISQQRISYDYEKTIAAIYSSGQPFADTYARRLRNANWFPVSGS
jgi:predicted phosphodiesterase